MLKFFCTVILKLGQSKTSNLPSWCNCKKYNLSFFGSRGEIVRKNDNVSILKMHNITYQVYGEKFWATWFTKGFRKNHSSGFSWVLPFLTPKVACLHHIWWAKSGRLAFQYLIFPSISYYFHIPKIFLNFFPHTGKNRNRRKSNLLP